MSNTIMEEFPTLPVRNTLPVKKTETRNRSTSAFSSVSTTSIGAFDEVTTEIPTGQYCTMDSVTLRQNLSCFCRSCQNKYPKEGEFEKCTRATFVPHGGIVCEVTDSKVVRHGKQKYSVAYIRSEATMTMNNVAGRRIRGWVKSKYLNRIFSASQSTTRALSTRMVEVDRSRSPSIMTEARVFRFRDLVLVRTDAMTEDWVRGEVRQEEPLLILAEGTSTPQRFHATNIKTCKTRQFVTVKNLAIRRNKFKDSWGALYTLKAGATVSVAYMEGFEGRITAPVQGWISMRDAHSLNVVEPDWTYSHQNPTIIVKNLGGDITEHQLKNQLLMRGNVDPMTITFQRKGDKFRALVSLRSRRHICANLVGRKGFTMDNGQRVEISWNMCYLKNLAKWMLEEALRRS